MADWRKTDWNNTWKNRKYRAAVLLAMLSVIVGGLGVAMTMVGHNYAWLIVVLHAIFIHVMSFNLAHSNEK